MWELKEYTILAKISRIEYLNAIQNGKLYMNNLKYYVDLEKNTGIQGIGDVLEASLIDIKKHKLFIQVDEHEIKEIPISPPPGIIYNNESLHHPVFCMMMKIVDLQKEKENQYIGHFQITREELNDFIEPDVDMGVLIIFDVEEFLNRVYMAAKKINATGKHGSVNYRDKRFPNIRNGKIVLDNSFTKDLRFQKQSEFRIELFINKDNPLILDIGDIHDISCIIKGDKITNRISIKYNEYLE